MTRGRKGDAGIPAARSSGKICLPQAITMEYLLKKSVFFFGLLAPLYWLKGLGRVFWKWSGTPQGRYQAGLSLGMGGMALVPLFMEWEKMTGKGPVHGFGVNVLSMGLGIAAVLVCGFCAIRLGKWGFSAHGQEISRTMGEFGEKRKILEERARLSEVLPEALEARVSRKRL